MCTMKAYRIAPNFRRIKHLSNSSVPGNDENFFAEYLRYVGGVAANTINRYIACVVAHVHE